MTNTELIRQEIERRIKSAELCPFIEAEFGAEMRREGKIQTYNEILSFIDSLQQEQPEVDLEKEIEKSLKLYYMLTVGKEDFTEIARHFYELGLNARKEE